MSMRLSDSAGPQGGPRRSAKAAKQRTVSGSGRAKQRHDKDVSEMARAVAAARESARHAQIAEEAYYRAERRGFAPGYETEDWLAAEAWVNGNGQGTDPGLIDDPIDERHASPDVTPVR